MIFVLRHMSNVTSYSYFRSKQFSPTTLKHKRQEICGVVSLTNTNPVHFVYIITIGTCTLLRLRQDIFSITLSYVDTLKNNSADGHKQYVTIVSSVRQGSDRTE